MEEHMECAADRCVPQKSCEPSLIRQLEVISPRAQCYTPIHVHKTHYLKYALTERYAVACEWKE